MTDQLSSIPAPDGAKPKREPARAVPLIHFLKDKTISVNKQLVAARRMPPPPMSELERAGVVSFMKQSADALQRFESLIAELPDANSEVASQVIAVAESYVEELGNTPEPLRINASSGVEGVWTVVRAIHGGANNPEEKRRRQAGVRFALWLGRLKGALRETDFIALVSRAFPRSGASKSGRHEELDLGALLASQLHRKSNRETLLRVTDHFNARIVALEGAVRDRDSENERQRAEVADLKNGVSQLENRVRELQEQLTQREAAVNALNQDITDHRAVKRQTEKQLRSRMGGFLHDQLLPLVRDIHDSASMEPVRAHVILDRTDSALTLIQKEAAWLTSSD